MEYFLMCVHPCFFSTDNCTLCQLARVQFFNTFFSSPVVLLDSKLQSPLVSPFTTLWNWIDFLTRNTVQKAINAWSLLHGALRDELFAVSDGELQYLNWNLSSACHDIIKYWPVHNCLEVRPASYYCKRLRLGVLDDFFSFVCCAVIKTIYVSLTKARESSIQGVVGLFYLDY
jgi:hypothetical protein